MTADAPIEGSTDKAPVVCVFCGASPGKSPEHVEQARALAQAFHKNGVKLVYGGGNVGVMGELAQELVRLSGPQSVHGVIPGALIGFERHEYDENGHAPDIAKKVDYNKFGRTTVVRDMHTRKQTMAKEVIEGGPGSGFVALSGGYGTLEELMEVVTWNQLGIHAKPVILFNVQGYWDGLLHWVNNAVDAGFIAQSNGRIMVEAKSALDVLQRLADYQNAEGRFKLEWNTR